MAILSLITVPDPRLSQKCRPVRNGELGPELERVINDMAETMYAAPGVGLAAPQVGDLRRFLVADPGGQEDSDGTRRGESFVVMINPSIVQASKVKYKAEEGCLSVPDLWEKFVRPQRVLIRWLDRQGQAQERWFQDYAGVVIQHEMDHLDGVTILDRVSRFKRSRYLRAQRKAKARK